MISSDKDDEIQLTEPLSSIFSTFLTFKLEPIFYLERISKQNS